MSNEEVLAFAAQLSKRIAEVGLSQAAVAEAAGMSQSMVSRLAKGEREPTMVQLVGLARALGCMPEELVHGTPQSSVLVDWVPAVDYAESEKERLQLERERDQLVAQCRVVEGERDALLERLRRVEDQVVRAEVERDGANAAMGEMKLDVARLRIANQTLQQANKAAFAKLRKLQEHTQSLKEGMIASAVMGTALGAILGTLRPK